MSWYRSKGIVDQVRFGFALDKGGSSNLLLKDDANRTSLKPE